MFLVGKYVVNKSLYILLLILMVNGKCVCGCVLREHFYV